MSQKLIELLTSRDKDLVFLAFSLESKTKREWMEFFQDWDILKNITIMGDIIYIREEHGWYGWRIPNNLLKDEPKK